MRKLLLVGMMMLVTAALVAAANPTVTISGWVGDSSCGASAKGPSHAACARNCIRNGKKAILINDKDGKAINIANQNEITSHAGEHVTVTGKLTADGSMHVNSVKLLGMK